MKLLNYLLGVLLNLFCLAYLQNLQAADAPLDGQKFGGRNLVLGEVESVDKSSGLPWIAQVRVTRILGRPMSQVKVGTLFRMKTGPQQGPVGTIPAGSDLSYVVPELKPGETGVWAMSENADHSGFRGESKTGPYGRLWPVIKGRNTEYDAVLAWAEELAKRPEIQADIDGKRWPAPKEGQALAPQPQQEAPAQPARVSQPSPRTSPVEGHAGEAPSSPPAVAPAQLPPADSPKTPTPTSSFLVCVGIAVVGIAACIWHFTRKRQP